MYHRKCDENENKNSYERERNKYTRDICTSNMMQQ
jgi:hypothetical protein